MQAYTTAKTSICSKVYCINLAGMQLLSRCRHTEQTTPEPAVKSALPEVTILQESSYSVYTHTTAKTMICCKVCIACCKGPAGVQLLLRCPHTQQLKLVPVAKPELAAMTILLVSNCPLRRRHTQLPTLVSVTKSVLPAVTIMLVCCCP